MEYGFNKRLIMIYLLLFVITSIVYGQYPPNTVFRTIEPPTDASPPAYLSTYDDMTTSTRLKRITKKGSTTHSYPKRQPWNIDETKYKLRTVAIYDAETHAVLKNLSGLDLYESVWSNTDPNLIYGFNSDGKIKLYHVDTGVTELLHNFNGSSKIYKTVKLGPGEGNVDIHDKYVAFVGESKDSKDVTILIFDLQLRKVVTTKTFINGWSNGGWAPKYIDWVSVSQSGNYLGIMWDHNSTSESEPFVDQNGDSHYGVEMYNTTDLKYLRRIVHYGNHGDFGFAPGGIEVFAQFYGYVPGVHGTVFSFHLDGSGVDVIHTNARFEVNGSHLSCRNILRPGWAYLNTKTYGGGDGRMIAVKLDGSEIIENFGHSFEKSGSDFYAYAAPVPNPTGTKIMFKSNLGDNSNEYKICSYEAYPILDEPIKSLSLYRGKYTCEHVVATDVNNFVSGSSWTMEAWVMFDDFDAPSGENHIMRLGGELFVDSNRKLKVKAGNSYGVGSTSLNANRWYHLAYVRTETEVTLYLDGKVEIVASGSDAGSADKFILGTFEPSLKTHSFSGKIDEVRLWDDARSQEEIQANKGKELKGTENNLLLYYDFNNGTGTTVVNKAGGNNNATLFNMDGSNWSTESPFKRPIDIPALPEGREVLSNNYFDYELSNWELYGEKSAKLSIDYTSLLEGKNSALVHISNTLSDSWKIQLRQMNLGEGVKEGKTYHIQFMVKSNKTINNIFAVIQQLHGSFSNVYSKEISLEANTKVTIVDTFVCKETDELVEWAFNLGTASVKDVDIWFDAVHFIELDGKVSVEKENAIPVKFNLEQNYPNPFNPTTVINFTLPQATRANVSIYNTLGEKVMEVANGEFSAGTHSVNVDASQLTSGIYFYKLKTANFSKTMKMMLLK